MRLFPFVASMKQRKYSTLWRVLVVFIVVFGVAATACKSREKFIDDARSFAALSGEARFALNAVNPQIKKIVVNFFAPDCPPCEKEIPALKAFYAAHAADVELLFVSIGSSLKAIDNLGRTPTELELRSEVKNFVTKFALPYPQYVATGDDLRSWRITGFPETFVFVRRQGEWMLRRKFISEVSREDLENELR